MSKWRTMWREAIVASAVMSLDPRTGEDLFRQLLDRYPSDPMVLYERGEAHENLAARFHKHGQVHDSLGQLALAVADYRRAREGMKEPHWIEAAEDALTGAAYARDGGRLPRERFLRSNIHRLHQSPHMPPEVMADAMSAVARFDSEPRLATADLGICMEQLVWILVQRAEPDCPPGEDLVKLIEQLPTDTPQQIKDRLHEARRLRNRAVHARQVTDNAHFRPMLEHFMAFATWSEPSLA